MLPLLLAAAITAAAATPSPTQLGAIKAMTVYEMQPGHTGARGGMRDKTCNVVGTWALCRFSDSGQNAVINVLMTQKSGGWKHVWDYGGAAEVKDFVKLGVPQSVAKRLLNAP
jgi:hypothetical protein